MILICVKAPIATFSESKFLYLRRLKSRSMTWEKFYLSLPLTLLLLSGCAVTHGKITPPEAKLAKIQTIEIIPIEPLPLELPPGISHQLSSDTVMLNTAVNLSMIPDSNIQPGARSFVLLSAFLMLIEAGAAGRESLPAEPSHLEETPAQTSRWIPTIVLAEKASAQISAGSSLTVTPIERYHILPVNDRSPTWHMNNWYKPIARWYNEETSTLDYSEHALEHVDNVLEVGLINYSLTGGGDLIISVLVRLIDPATREVLGRSRAIKYRGFGDPQDLLANDGAKFKQAFRELGGELVNECLKDIGLLPK